MQELVAIDMAGGPAFVEAVRRAWDGGDAILPIDHRLPSPARTALLAVARPHAIVTGATEPTGLHLERQPYEPAAPPVAEGDALVVASSGTTGEPKLLVHTHGSVMAHAEAVHLHLAVDPTRDRWLACLPLAHLGGLGVVLRSLKTQTPLDVLAEFDADQVTAAAARLGSTLVSLVPTALDRIDASAFRWVVLGGSGDPTARPPNVVHTYGLTETGGGVVYDGRLLPGVQARLGPGGAIYLAGSMLARGQRLASGAVTPIVDSEGWFATGDLGRWSTDGRLLLDGRADDLIVTGGENVWPEQVEAALASYPGIAEAAVAGRPDPEWGAIVVAFVVAVDPHQPPTLDALRDHVRQRLPAYAAPRELVLVDRLPRTSLGKVRRRDLVV